MKTVVLLKAGDAALPVRLTAGDYDRWFLQTLGLSGYRFDVIPAHQGAKLPADVSGYDAVMMTGSPLSVTRLEPWMERAAAFMMGAADRGIPVLGVCFGHQLLAHAHGGRVDRNPLGREIGTVEVLLTDPGREDPLFHGLPVRLAVQATHEDIVVEPPSGATVLAGNANTAVQALAFRPHVRGVQFHPEVQPSTMRALIEARAERLEAEAIARGQPPGERVPRLLAGIQPTPAGPQILTNFLERFS
ncbi:glutamine amidotransferase [Stigmatella aurantiaca]|uniref:Class I glutamine amidotransferase family protein n=1 Tax=Stigmatella aurantiaca (strain DW4/3-1) TaxID=378806 RepID=Q08QS8_STIAD|nr:glutamine amidotransferase [Stigmatella aurantiaca]ADO74068.1 Class I glutamine amidotransferase family protein [Stigmatella aurantiaca DW4/3-1]EAU62839.1 GMP synthase (glutamine-hydrolyzing) [Stigmatella aurantiaca DW4/3-1]